MRSNRFETQVRFDLKTFVVQADLCSAVMPGYLELFQRYPYADGLRDVSTCEANSPADAERLTDALRRGEITYAGIGWLLYSAMFCYAGRKLGKSPKEYADYLYAVCTKVNQDIGYRGAWMEAFGEVGNGVVWPKDRALTKTEALAYFRDWYVSGRVSSIFFQKSRVPADALGFYGDAKGRSVSLRDLPIHNTEAVLYVLQESFRFGFPLVVYECQCGTMESIQTGIAFARGGAKIFDAWWGVDFSPWDCTPMHGKVEPGCDSVGNWRAGVTPDHQFRSWISTYMSGVNSILHEWNYRTFYAQPMKGLTIPSDMGHLAMKFYGLTRHRLADRGLPLVPFAVILEEAHGYGTECMHYYENKNSAKIEITGSDGPDRKLYVWHGKVEASRGDWALCHLIRKTLFPTPDGIWRDLGAAEWPERRKSDFAWDKAPSMEELWVQESDTRDCSRFVGDSRWADCFDFVLDTAPAERLVKFYRVLLLGGAIQTNATTWDTLRQFTAQGGTVLCSLDNLGPDARQALGLRATGEAVETFVEGETLAVCPTEAGDKTLVVTRKIGEGSVHVMLFTHGMTADGVGMSKQFDRIIDALYAEHVGVFKHGPPCQMLVNLREDDTVITLANHSGKDWRGEIRVVRAGKPEIEEVRDLVSDDVFPAHLVGLGETEVAARVRVPAYGVRVIAFGKRRERQAELSFHRPIPAEEMQDFEAFRGQGADKILPRGEGV